MNDTERYPKSAATQIAGSTVALANACANAGRSSPEGRSIRANVGVELKGVRSGVERRRGRGLKARGDGRREMHAGK